MVSLTIYQANPLWIEYVMSNPILVWAAQAALGLKKQRIRRLAQKPVAPELFERLLDFDKNLRSVRQPTIFNPDGEDPPSLFI